MGFETNTISYEEILTYKDSTFPCPEMPSCTVYDLNRTDSGIDRDQRNFTVYRNHLPGSKVFTKESHKEGIVFYTTVTIRD